MVDVRLLKHCERGSHPICGPKNECFKELKEITAVIFSIIGSMRRICPHLLDNIVDNVALLQLELLHVVNLQQNDLKSYGRKHDYTLI